MELKKLRNIKNSETFTLIRLELQHGILQGARPLLGLRFIAWLFRSVSCKSREKELIQFSERYQYVKIIWPQTKYEVGVMRKSRKEKTLNEGLLQKCPDKYLEKEKISHDHFLYTDL